MWLFVPSMSCPSVPESEDLNSESGLPNPEPAPCASSNGKLTPRPLSWRGWRTRPWIQHLVGTMSKPLTAARGVESWIVSLEATRVSRSQSLESAGVQKIQDTSGPISPGSSEKCRQLFASSKMCPTTSTSDSKAYVKTFGEWVTALKREYLARQKLVPHTSENDSSSWPTATAQDSVSSGASGYQTETRHAGTTLTDAAVRQWPTARATDGAKGGPNQHGSKGDLTLPSAAVQWPTPASRDHKGGADWSKRTRNGKQRLDSERTLPDVAEFWATPQVADVTGGHKRRSGNRSNELLLPGQAEQWPTPAASTYGSNRGGSGGRVGPIRPSLQGLVTRQGGPKCRLMLNPLFVEMLMGLPPHWTCVCRRSETGTKSTEVKNR